MAEFDPQSTGTLSAVLDQMSLLLSDVDIWSEEAESAIEVIFDALTPELRRHGEVPLHIESDGTVRLAGRVIDAPSEKRNLGHVLSRVGVTDLMLTDGLELIHLTKFLQTVSLMGEEPAGTEGDLVTYWTEEGEDSIRFVATKLCAHHLLTESSSAPNEARLFQALMSPLDRRSSTHPKWASFAEHILRGRRIPPQDSGSLLTDEDWDALELHFERVLREDDSSLRRQFTASLMALMSAQAPALTPTEVGFLAVRLVCEHLTHSEFDDVSKLVRNLEFLVQPETNVSPLTRSRTEDVLSRLKSARVLQALVTASDDAPPPYKLVRWFIGDDSLEKWRLAAKRIDDDEIDSLVVLFSIIYAFQHPFWKDAIEAVDRDQANEVERIINQLETRWADEENLQTIDGPPPTAAASSDDFDDDDDGFGWDDFALDTLDLDAEEKERHELDASLIAFLDSSESRLGVKPRKPKAGGSRSAIASDMMHQLDALEASIVRGKMGRDD